MSKQKQNNSDLLRYAGLGAQIFVSLGIAVYIGHLADSKWLQLSFPIFTIVLPVLVLAGLIYSLIKETSKKKDNDTKKQI